MSYAAGILFGPNPSHPCISCDHVGCDARVVIDGLPPVWFLKKKAPPGWATVRDMGRRDYCPQHRPAPREQT